MGIFDRLRGKKQEPEEPAALSDAAAAASVSTSLDLTEHALPSQQTDAAAKILGFDQDQAGRLYNPYDGEHDGDPNLPNLPHSSFIFQPSLSPLTHPFISSSPLLQAWAQPWIDETSRALIVSPRNLNSCSLRKQQLIAAAGVRISLTTRALATLQEQL